MSTQTHVQGRGRTRTSETQTTIPPFQSNAYEPPHFSLNAGQPSQDTRNQDTMDRLAAAAAMLQVSAKFPTSNSQLTTSFQAKWPPHRYASAAPIPATNLMLTISRTPQALYPILGA